MRVILIATGQANGLAPLDEHYPAPLLPLLDRPFLQHVVEYVAQQGVTRFDFVLSQHPERFEDLLGDGTRWGCRFTFHLAGDALRPYRALQTLDLGPDGEPVLLGHADRLPPVRLSEVT